MIASLKARGVALGLVVVLALALALALASRGKSGAKAGHALPTPPLVSACEPGKPGGRFVFAAPASPRTFNPLFAFDGPSDGITRLLYGSLVNLNMAAQETGPGLAESWSVAPDGKTWTFNLRRGLRWSDGVPLTADDVVFTWNSIMYNPQYNLITYDLFRIGGKNFDVARIDDYTVRVATPEVFAPFLEFFGGVPILPKHILEAATKGNRFPAAYGVTTHPERLVGCGPYRLKEFRPGKYTLLERNPEYWVTDKTGRRLPYFDEVMAMVGSAPGEEERMFLDGKSDVFESVRPQDYAGLTAPGARPSIFRRLLSLVGLTASTARRHFRLLEMGAGMDREVFWFNENTGTDRTGKPLVDPVKLKWFRDRRFRQGISCAINRARIVREVYAGRAQPMYGFISEENQKWRNPNLPQEAYNPAKARALLAECGLADRKGDGVMTDAEGHPVEILFYSNTGNPLREKAARLIGEDLQKLGIRLVYTPVDFQTLVTKVNVSFGYECVLMGLGGGGGDPASQINVLRSSEELHQWFPSQKAPSTDWEARLDHLMDAQMRTLDFAQRKKDFDEAQMILAEETPMIYTVSPFAYAAIREDVGNVRPSVLAAYRATWNLEELYFKPH